MQAQKLTKKNYLFGFGIAVESLASTINVDFISLGILSSAIAKATGKTTQRNTCVTANAFIGHRFVLGKVFVDLSAGVDVAFCARSHEKGNATSIYIIGTNSFSTNNYRDKPLVDFRPRLQFKTQYIKISLNATYSFGLANFQNYLVGEAKTSFLRFGVGYIIK